LRTAAGRDAPSFVDLAAWRRSFHPSAADTFSSALDAGLGAGQLAFCFAGGYQSALRVLLPTLPPDAFGALLVTEGKRQRPEDILSTLTPLTGGRFLLDGEKSWVAGGSAATHLLVLARQEVDSDGRRRSALVLLPPSARGVTLDDRPPAGFLDAVPHARAKFDGVEIESSMLLPGDGWRDHARPFRTIEDIHVSTAIAAHLAVNGLRRHWPPALLATLVSALVRLAQCAARDPRDPHTQLLLAGAEQELVSAGSQVSAWYSGEGRAADEEFARDWRSNNMLLALAAPARAKRLEKAIASL
jgi:acyl-CoA dehydrogenase